MENYIVMNGQRVELTEKQVARIRESFREKNVKLATVAAGETCMIGSHEMIVLEHIDGNTLLLRKDALEKMRFGENNNYDGSAVDRVCNEFAGEVAEIVGEDNIVLHEVDMTADDGLKDYGKVSRKASLRTANMQRKYVEVLDKYRLDDWEWLATAYTTPTHDEDNWVKCVSPAGSFNNYDSNYFNFAVRPFCILKSDIFVSN